VRQGQSYVVTSHGRPVAKLIPAETDERNAAAARAALLARLKSQPAAKGPKAQKRWTRDELCDDQRESRWTQTFWLAQKALTAAIAKLRR
jgi:antitoxin (DNA-binding transcriptional repressor) of toxin-antitoxin stability system